MLERLIALCLLLKRLNGKRGKERLFVVRFHVFVFCFVQLFSTEN